MSKVARQILFIDDDASMRSILEGKLFQSGYAVTCATSGLHAMQIMRSGRTFDLILTDLKMPGKGGIDVIKFVNEMRITSPVILVTGSPERDKIVWATQLGIKDVLVKPFKYQELLAMMEKKLKDLPHTSETGKPA